MSDAEPVDVPNYVLPGRDDTGSPNRGDPVKVKLTAPYRSGFMQSVGITLTAIATMRLEQKPTVIGDLPPSC